MIHTHDVKTSLSLRTNIVTTNNLKLISPFLIKYFYIEAGLFTHILIYYSYFQIYNAVWFCALKRVFWVDNKSMSSCLLVSAGNFSAVFHFHRRFNSQSCC